MLLVLHGEGLLFGGPVKLLGGVALLALVGQVALALSRGWEAELRARWRV